MAENWLRCRVAKGMFSNERVIVVDVKGNGSIEELVPEDSVKEEGEEGYVSVRVFDGENGPWAELPTTYRRAIPIEEDQLEPA